MKDYIWFKFWYNKELDWGGLTILNKVMFNFGLSDHKIW
jgi:hypothetical protein